MADEIISLSRIESYLICPHAYYLDEKKQQEGLPITGFDAKRIWLKRAFKGLLPEKRYVGVDLKLEQLRGDELAKALNNKSAVAFGKAQSGTWKWHVIKNKGKIRSKGIDSDIVWLFENQWRKAAKQIRQACEAYYSYLLQEGTPVSYFTDADIPFDFGKRKWIVQPGVVRYGGIVEEVQTHKLTKREVDHDWTIAPKLYAIYTLSQNPANKIKWGMNSDGLQYRCLSLSNGEHRFYEAKSVAHMYAALGVIEDVEKRIARGEFDPNHEKCKTCRYNVLTNYNKPACEERNRDFEIMKPMNQLVRW